EALAQGWPVLEFRRPVPLKTAAHGGRARFRGGDPAGSRGKRAARTAEVLGAYRPKAAHCSLRAPAEPGPEACAGP
ncbi:hypothetical protein ABZ760_27385, partial [Streptomyces sp. NPDC006658]|uniref:hypothetical protein n=1 Tax=Streptomyces sp. NPDC006658 TaxID=3156900 RepID=UPI0034051806